jgi:hypothetical protein
MTSSRWIYFAFVLVALVVLVSCGSNQKSASNPETVSAASTTKAVKLPQPITALQALQKMEGFAQKQWSADAMPLHIESEPNSEANGQDGKSTVWRATFGSMKRGELRTFHWSSSLDADAPVQGVSAASATSPLTPQLAAEMFQGFLVKTDSDRAAQIAVEHGGKRILEKFPQQQVRYIVVFDTKTNAPMCYVIYGEGIKKNRGFGVIHGMTGDFLRGGKAG